MPTARDASIETAKKPLLVPADALRGFIADVLTAKAMFRFDAETVAARIVEADLRGHSEQGVEALPQHLAAIAAGDIEVRARVLPLHETAAMAVLDGGRSMGHVAATAAMDLAIAKAADVGTGTVAVKNTRACGAAAVYVLSAVRQGMIGMATISAPDPTHGIAARSLTAFGIPRRDGPPLIVDTSTVAALWASAAEAGAVANPAEQFDAARLLQWLLPGVLTGALVGAHCRVYASDPPAGPRAEHFFQVIDPRQFGEDARFDSQLAALLADLRACAQEHRGWSRNHGPVLVADLRACAQEHGGAELELPGEREFRRAESCERDGIPLSRDLAEVLGACATAVRVGVPW